MSYHQYPPTGQPPGEQGYYGQQSYPNPQQQGQQQLQGYYPAQSYHVQQSAPPSGPYAQQQAPAQVSAGQYGQYPHPHGYYQQPAPQRGQYQQPPPEQYQQPPPEQYHLPPPGQYPQTAYGQYLPQQQTGYGAPPPPPPPPPPPQQPYYGGYQQPPPHTQGYGYPPQQHPYGAPTQLEAAHTAADSPSPGYGAPHDLKWNAGPDAAALTHAMKGLGTDEKTLIRVLSRLEPLQVTAVRKCYDRQAKKHAGSLVKDIKSETSGWFEKGLVSLAVGPLGHDVMMLHDAMDGPGTKEKVLNDVLLGRSNADMKAMKSEYARLYGTPLETKVQGDLSMKTKRHFLMVLAADRAEKSAPVVREHIERDVIDLYRATEGKAGTDELLVCNILTRRNDAQLRNIAWEYKRQFNVTLETVIKKEFSGHMEDALLYQLRHACDPHMHRAMLLEDAMSGVGTQDHLLVSRVVRFHWDKEDLLELKAAYHKWKGRHLAKRIKGETSGHYEKLMLACIDEPW